VKHLLILGALLAATSVAAQPVQPMPAASTPVSDQLTSAPYRDISNVLMTARVATPDGTRGFYRGTRFD
jgi:hypothetical protein